MTQETRLLKVGLDSERLGKVEDGTSDLFDLYLYIDCLGRDSGMEEKVTSYIFRRDVGNVINGIYVVFPAASSGLIAIFR